MVVAITSQLSSLLTLASSADTEEAIPVEHVYSTKLLNVYKRNKFFAFALKVPYTLI